MVWSEPCYLLPFSRAHCRVIHDTFIFNHSVIFLLGALRFWDGIFYPQVFFALCSFITILLVFIKAFLGASSSSLKFAGLHTDPWNTDLTRLFVWFTVIHSLNIQNNSVLNSTKYYHELLVVKVLFICSLLGSSNHLLKVICKDYQKTLWTRLNFYCLWLLQWISKYFGVSYKIINF